MRVHVNCAISLDGRLANRDGSPLRLSDAHDMRRVHGLRAACDAILVGVGTVLADDPSLRLKQDLAEGNDPTPVILDTGARVPAGARVMREGTLWVHADDVHPTVPPGVVSLPVPRGTRGVDLEAMLEALEGHGIGSLLVEGGAAVLRSFLETDAWDVLTVYQAPVAVGGGPSFPGIGEAPWWPHAVPQAQGAGVLWTISPQPL